MNPRQRKGIVLIFFTIVGALVTFGLVLSYVNSVASQVGCSGCGDINISERGRR